MPLQQPRAEKPLQSAFKVLCFYKWSCESGRKHHKEDEEEEGRKTKEEKEEESVFAGPG